MIKFKTYNVIRPVSQEVVADSFKNLGGREIIFVAPEFSKAQVEREVLSYKAGKSRGEGKINTGEAQLTLSSALVNGDVISFRKLAGNILDDLGTNYVAEGGEIMLRNAIYVVLLNNKSKLLAFDTLSSRIDYINMMIALLGDFSRYGVGIDEINEAIKALDTPTASDSFIKKLKDLRLIMTELEQMNVKYGLNLLKEPIALACDKLSAISRDKLSLRRSSGLASIIRSKIVFIGFGSTRQLTPKEVKLVSLLSDLGADIEFNVMSAGSATSVAAVYKTGEDFRGVLEGLGATGEALTVDGKEDCLSLIVKGFASDVKPDGIDAEGRIKLAELASVDDRVGYIFSEVIDLTRNKGYRYRDIRIVCCNEELMTRMRSTAELYGLDIFVDRKIALGGTVVPYMMQILLELPRVGYTLELFMKAMRSGMLMVPPYIADSFENFCYARNIMDAGRMFDRSSYIQDEDEEAGDGRRSFGKTWIIANTVPGYKEGFVDSGKFFYEQIVVRTLIPLRAACEKIFNEKTLSGKAKASIEYLDSMRGYIEPLRDELLSRGDNDAAVALVRGYDELISLLMCSTHEMNDCEISQKDFLAMVRTDMSNRTEGTIPLKVDSIEITTPEHAFVTPCKVLFILGAQKDNFPYVRMREGLLSGIELKSLSSATEKIELPDKVQNKMREEFVTACLLLGSAQDILYMVHEYGKPKSRVFEYLEGFVDLKYHIVNTFKNPVAGEFVKLRHDFEEAKIPEETMTRLLTGKRKDGSTGKVIYMSVSQIENFRVCALPFMLDKQLKIRPREDNTKIMSNSFGSLIHSMFEEAYKHLRDESGKDSEEFKRLAKEILDNEEKYNSFADFCLKKAVSSRASFGSVDKDGNPKDIIFEMDTYAKLRRMFSKMFNSILQDSYDTGFVPEGVEAAIGQDDLILSIPYEGMELNFSGYIDRYDVRYDEDGKTHIRTIDYKSGDKAVESEKLLAGTQIQLPSYSGAILEMNAKEGKNAVVDDYGYVLVGLKSKLGEGPLECMPLLSGYNEGEMNIAINYAKYIIKESADQISAGKADAITSAPKSSKCSYCPYSGFCGNTASNSKGRPKPDLSNFPKSDKVTLDGDKIVEVRRVFLAMKDIMDNADGSKEKEV